MREEVLINSSPQEVRAALLDNGILQEILVERTSRRGLVGNIYKGRASRVLPGMQAAFIELGLQRSGFLHVSDIAVNANQEAKDYKLKANIDSLLKEGDEVVVQVLKDPLGSKGARLTTRITIQSTYLVMSPYGKGIGVSSRISDDQERERLRQMTEDLTASNLSESGYIVRTAAEGSTTEDLRADIQFLQKLWTSIMDTIGNVESEQLIYEDLLLPLRLLRDLLGSGIERIRVDSEIMFDKVKDFADCYMPQISHVIEHYSGNRPIFDLYRIEGAIEQILDKKVPLESGGYLVMDQTEAMTTIDVNTGSFIGHNNLEDTSFQINLEAVEVIARQLRLRNIGGIIIIDFIDMIEPKHRDQVFKALLKFTSRDRAKTQITDFSSLGLVEMTRKRTHSSLEQTLCETCPSCTGRGLIKSPETVCYEVFREIHRQHMQCSFQELLVLARPEVIEMLLNEESVSLIELEELVSAPIRLQSESFHSPDQFDVVSI
ncbi:MAG: ribonuclease G [Gammaproteobacteria bacterium]|nr:ribonuclease G [Gammaproteobacteria bacterium]